jgi:uncharacterized Zn finger protein
MSAFPSHQRVTPHMARKGRRLHRDGKVRFLPNARVYAVEGDTPDKDGDPTIYAVVVNHSAFTCTCPHHGTCSHIQAVRIARRDNEASARALPLTPRNNN